MLDPKHVKSEVSTILQQERIGIRYALHDRILGRDAGLPK
jgi:hypothetical protein